MIVRTPLLRFGAYAILQKGTVLHQMLVPDEPVQVKLGHRVVTVPKPNLPVHELCGEDGEPYALAVTLGPPWSLLDDAVRGEPNAHQNLVTWLKSAIRSTLVGEAACYYRPGIMGFAKGDPRIPRGEVWIGTEGVRVLFQTGIAVRYPVASPTSAQPVVVRATEGTGIWINDRVLVEEMQGDSDGDLLMVIAGQPGLPEQVELPKEPPCEFDSLIKPTRAENKSRLEVALGYKAREAVGLLTWQCWFRARANADLGDVYEAWKEAYSLYTEAIEACMDGRKEGKLVTARDFALMPDSANHVLLHGVNNMVRSRWRSPIPLRIPPDQLLRDYWSGQWSGMKPISIGKEE